MKQHVLPVRLDLPTLKRPWLTAKDVKRSPVPACLAVEVLRPVLTDAAPSVLPMVLADAVVPLLLIVGLAVRLSVLRL